MVTTSGGLYQVKSRIQVHSDNGDIYDMQNFLFHRNKTSFFANICLNIDKLQQTTLNVLVIF